MAQKSDKHVVLIGHGNMGRAMLSGWLETNTGMTFTVVDPALSDQDKLNLQHKGVMPRLDLQDLDITPDIAVLAVKPQMMEKIGTDLSQHLIPGRSCVLSIAAGCTISGFESLFGENMAVIRAMPNTPAAIGAGVVIATANQNVLPEHKVMTEKLLKPLGFFDWLEKEMDIDAVTAISGSGPAYVFYFLEALSEAGQALGLQKDLSKKLALETVKGAAELAIHEQETEFSSLRKNVTSPGGTTEAALNVLTQKDILKDLVLDTAKAAKKRSEELSGQS